MRSLEDVAERFGVSRMAAKAMASGGDFSMTVATAKRLVVRLGREQRIEEILAAARDEFVKQGYDRATTAEIAARAGVVEGTVYKYFQTKRELLLKTIESWYEGLVREYATDLIGIQGTRQRFRFLVWRHLRAIRDDPGLSRLMFSEVRPDVDYHHSALHLMNRRYTQFLVNVVHEGIEAGEFRSDIPLALVRDMVFGGIEHHTWNFVRGHGPLEAEAIADQVTTLVCDGLATQQLGDDLRRQIDRLAVVSRALEKTLQKKGRPKC
jgi:AcrR family transcriptional regulator